MGVIALIALMVLGPKELPQAMRAASKWVRKARSLAREFQSGIDDMIREADLEDARKAVQGAKNFEIEKALEETLDPEGEIGEEAKDLERTARSEGTIKKPEAPKGSDALSSEAPAAGEGAKVIEHPLKAAPPPAEGSEVAPAGTAPAGTDSASKRA